MGFNLGNREAKDARLCRAAKYIQQAYSDALILTEVYTGTKTDRPEWPKLLHRVKAGDIIVFDSVSRMSRDAEEGFLLYCKNTYYKYKREMKEG